MSFSISKYIRPIKVTNFTSVIYATHKIYIQLISLYVRRGIIFILLIKYLIFRVCLRMNKIEFEYDFQHYRPRGFPCSTFSFSHTVLEISDIILKLLS